MGGKYFNAQATLFAKGLILRVIKFLSVGAIATAIQYALLVIQVEVLSVSSVVASFIAYSLSSVVNYLMNYYFTFGSTAKHLQSSAKFVLVAVIGLVVNTVLMYALIEIAGVHYLFAQIISTLIVLVWNYLAHKHWTYRSN